MSAGRLASSKAWASYGKRASRKPGKCRSCAWIPLVFCGVGEVLESGARGVVGAFGSMLRRLDNRNAVR